MALTSAERQSFEHIVTQLSTSDRWFTWRTRPTTRRGLWVRRQICHVIGAGLLVCGLVTVAASLLVSSALAVRSVTGHLGRGMRTLLVGVARHLALWARAFWRRLSHHKKPRP